MKRIYLLPYTNKTFFHHNKRVSGVDTAVLNQYYSLKERGYTVGLYAGQTDLHKFIENVDYYTDEEHLSPKQFESDNREKIDHKMLESIAKFKPDVIISSREFSKIYYPLMAFKVPILYMSHTVPGFWMDYTNANSLYDFLMNGHSVSAVSEYHKKGMLAYYQRKRKGWKFDRIDIDFVLYTQYTERKTAIQCEKVVKHCSVAHKQKDTFLIHSIFEDTDIPTEVYTSNSYFGYKPNDYVENALKKYVEYPRQTFLNMNHENIVQSMANAGCAFVGLAPYDSCPITALEALSQGVPVIAKGKGNIHPSKELLTDKYKKYVHVYKDKNDFIETALKFMNLTVEERNAIANSCATQMSKEKFTNNLIDALHACVEKYLSNRMLNSSNLMKFL